MNIKNELKISIEINEKELYSFSEKINEQKIIETATKIEKLLLNNGASNTKIKTVYTLTIEILQNILNYSYDSEEVKDNKMEAYGSFCVSFHSTNDTYYLTSCNLIQKNQEAIISSRIDSLMNLNNQQLRTIGKEKMRSHRDNHEKGAGLGLITIAKKSSKPILYEFISINEDITKCKLIVTI